MNPFTLAAIVGVTMFLAGAALPYLWKLARRWIGRVKRGK